MLGGSGVNDVQDGPGWFGRDEAEHVLQQRVDDGMHPVVLEGRPVILVLPHLDVTQRGWSPERYEHFLADTWRRLLLVG